MPMGPWVASKVALTVGISHKKESTASFAFVISGKQVALHRGATGVDVGSGFEVSEQLVLANMLDTVGIGAAAIAVPNKHKFWLKADAP
jgi:hypothetical protein